MPSFPDGADAPQLRANWSLLSESEATTALSLLSAGQAHLFAAWPPLGERDADKKRLLAQVCRACGLPRDRCRPSGPHARSTSLCAAPAAQWPPARGCRLSRDWVTRC